MAGDSARRCRVATLDQHEVVQPRRVAAGEAEFRQPDELALVHRNAAGHVVQVFTRRDLDGQLFGLAELALGLQPGGVIDQFAQGCRIGGEPGETMRRMLLLIQKA